MVKTFFNGVSKMFVAVVAVVALVAFCGTTAQAQVSAKADAIPSNTVNPEKDKADKMGLVAYNLATFQKVAQGTAALTTEVNNLKPTLNNATALNKFKYAYFSQILTDMSFDVAPEISVLTSLGGASTTGAKADASEMATLYEQAVNLLK